MKTKYFQFVVVLLFAAVATILSPGVAFAGSVSSIQGVDRFDTAAREAYAAYPNGCDTAIVVGSEGWSDALSALGLAGALDCPILFVDKSYVPAVTSQALSTLGVSEVIVLGGENSIALETEQFLVTVGSVESVRRVCGDNRFLTQMEIYKFGKTGYDGVDHWGREIAIVVSGLDFPDALSAAPLAFSQAAPIFLVDGSGQLTGEQESALMAGGFKKAVVIGSGALVADETLGYLEALTMFVSGEVTPNAVRLWGADRFETNARVVQWCVNEGYLSWSSPAFASGYLPYDALAGGVVQGKKKGAILLVSHQSNYSIAAAVSNRSSISSITYFGSTAAISQHLRKEIEYRLGWYAPSASEILGQVESSSGSYDIASFGTDFVPSWGNYSRLESALSWFRSSGYRVGFAMVDLKTGQGIASGIDQAFYSASTIKGPYVASINKYQPDMVWPYSNTMQQTINVSSNSGYATLRYRFGAWPFAQYLSDAQVYSFSSSTWYPYFRVKDLAKLWVANYDYFYGTSANLNSSFCRNLFTSSYHSPLYYEFGWQYTVHSKPGWINQGSPRTFNDAGIVMAGDRPYLVVICSDAWERFDMMQNLARVLEDVHNEMVG